MVAESEVLQHQRRATRQQRRHRAHQSDDVRPHRGVQRASTRHSESLAQEGAGLSGGMSFRAIPSARTRSSFDEAFDGKLSEVVAELQDEVWKTG